MPRDMLSEESVMFFFFGIIALGNVLIMFWIGCSLSVSAVGNLDLTLLMRGGILYVLFWSMVDNLLTKALGGVLTSSIIILRSWNSKPCNFISSSQGDEINHHCVFHFLVIWRIWWSSHLLDAPKSLSVTVSWRFPKYIILFYFAISWFPLHCSSLEWSLFL